MDPSSNIKSVLLSCCTEERDTNRFSSGLTNADEREASCLQDPDSSGEGWDEGSFVSLRDVELGATDVEPRNLRLDKPETNASGSSRRRLKQERALQDEDLELFDGTDHSEERIDSREVALLNRITRRQGIPRSKTVQESEPESESVVRDAPRSSVSASVRAANAANAAQKNMNRRRQIDPTTCERDYSREEIEFMRAMDNYKRTSGRMFPTCSEILEVVRSLGYVKIQNGPY